MAGILKPILESPSPFSAGLAEYSNYLAWVRPDLEQQLNVKYPELDEILQTHYHYWNKKSGQSRGLLKKANQKTKDRSRPLQSAIPWKVALDSFRSGYNVGSIIRSAEAFGLTEVIIGGNSPGPQNKAVQSAAMGTENWIPLISAINLAQWLEETAEAEEAEIIGLEISNKAIDLMEVEFPQKGILILGNEERGISQRVLKRCSRLVNIPLYGRKFSLNVASAFAILAHALRRQFNRQKAF